MAKEHNEATLPKWAQRRLAEERLKSSDLRDELDRTKAASAVLHEREWFTLPGPTQNDEWPKDVIRLFVLSRNNAHPVCSLGRGDILLVGRSRMKEKERHRSSGGDPQ